MSTVVPAELQRETRSSIELQRSVKGDYYWTVKVYFDREDATEPEATLALLGNIDAQLRQDYTTRLEAA